MSLCLQRIQLHTFRNYENLNILDIPNLNIIVGQNATGKTNILEAISLVTSLSSFKTSHLQEAIQQNQNTARINADFIDGARKINIALTLQNTQGVSQRTYTLNTKKKKVQDLKGLVPAVCFTPDDLLLVKGTPSLRLKALDNLGAQLSKNHYLIKKDYEKIITYKNKLLKEEAPTSLIESINDQLIKCGASLICYRVKLFQRLALAINTEYKKINNNNEDLISSYFLQKNKDEHIPTTEVTIEEAKETLRLQLEEKFTQEKLAKRSIIGPGHDLIEFFINNQTAEKFGSQGQQRSIVLAWKLAEIKIIEETLQQKPIILLDDVMGELDDTRKKMLLENVNNNIQSFITTTTLHSFPKEIIESAKIIELPKFYEEQQGL